MRRIIKLVTITIATLFVLAIAGILFTGQHFCIGNTNICFTSE